MSRPGGPAPEQPRDALGRFSESARPEAAGVDLVDDTPVCPDGYDPDWYSRLTPFQQRQLTGEGDVDARDAGGDVIAVRPGVIDEDADYVYMQGQCLALAVAMSERTGWPVVVLRDDLDDVDAHGDPFYNLRHALVQAPDGTLLDIRGEQGGLEDVVQADETFTDDEIEPLVLSNPYEALEVFDGYIEDQDLVVAESFAQEVLARYRAGEYSCTSEPAAFAP